MTLTTAVRKLKALETRYGDEIDVFLGEYEAIIPLKQQSAGLAPVLACVIVSYDTLVLASLDEQLDGQLVHSLSAPSGAIDLLVIEPLNRGITLNDVVMEAGSTLVGAWLLDPAETVAEIQKSIKDSRYYSRARR